MSAEEILAKLKETENEIKIADEKRLAIVARIQSLKDKADKLKAKYNLLKTKEVSQVDWAQNKYDWDDKIHNLLKDKFKLKSFRHQQLAAINAVLSGKDIILLMPTGGGKSLCYQLPALVTKGITLVVSPLLSLIDDQIISLKKIGIDATALNSSNSKTEGKRVFDALANGESSIKLIYVTPEWLAKSKRFMTNLQKCYGRKGLDRIAIDEVHCCSQWGHDFRPDYKYLSIFKNIFPNIPIIGLTATATESIIVDCQNMLNIEGSLVLKASYNRPNLFYEVKRKPSEQENCLKLLENLITNTYKNESGIIYTYSINDCADLATNLKSRGVSIACYHANMEPELRQKVHSRWLNNHYQVVVATVAFGMGIGTTVALSVPKLQVVTSHMLISDKPDVRFVIHHSLPKSMENFYQESGRAGRDDKRADCILLYSLKDVFRISSMVCTTPKGTDNLYNLVDYCLNADKCRRSIIATHFDEVWDATQCNEMCDHCKNPNCYETMDITKYNKDIYKIIQHAEKFETRLTVIKLIDNWFKSGNSKTLRPPDVNKPSISKETAENIIAFLLIKKYLKEDIHFTPYNTISYINLGAKSYCTDTITMKIARNISRSISNSQIPKNKRKTKETNDENSDQDISTKKKKIITIDDSQIPENKRKSKETNDENSDQEITTKKKKIIIIEDSDSSSD